jgi:NAD(P)-dependent dehydrogenase (short-subunit alcohol dehydrogenase family)
MEKSIFSLENRVAVVTGGAGDLGFAIAKAYREAGATVVLAGRHQDRLDRAVDRLGGGSQRLAARVIDVADASQVNAMMDDVVRGFGRIDILVTAAGVQHRSPAASFGHDAWNEVLRVNLDGTFYCAQAAARYMIPKKTGRIIMITSLTAEIGIPHIAAYAASRGGIRQLCKTMAVEWAEHGVTVNCIGPGRFRTRMTEDVFADETKRAKFLGVIPMRRAGVPDDLAGAAVFLASESSSYVTGQSLYIDGGWLAGGGNVLG